MWNKLRQHLSGPDLAGDLWGGLSAMLVALPAAVAFGVVIYAPLGASYAALGAMAGIIGTVTMGLVVPLYTGAPRLISAPCAPAAAVLSGVVAGLLAAPSGQTPPPPAQVVVLLTFVALLAGGLQFLYGVIGGGKLIKYIPYPVVSGYLSGVGILIFLQQLPNLFGLPKGIALGAGLRSPSLWQGPSLAVGLVTIGTVLLAPRFTSKIPATIVGLAAGIAGYFAIALLEPPLLRLEGNPLLIGPLGSGGHDLGTTLAEHWRTLGQFDLALLGAALVPALTLSVLLSIDTLKTCVVVDALTRSRHNSNRTLIAQGLGNVATALSGGVSGAGTMGATMVSISSGGKTRLSGLCEGALALIVLLLLTGLIGWVPLAALAGILIVVALRMLDRHSLVLLRHRSTILDFAIIAVVVVVAVTVDLIAAAATGVAMAFVHFLREQIRSSVIRRKLHGHEMFSKQYRLPDERALLEQYGDQTVICQLQGSLFFGTTDQLFSELEEDIKSRRFVILDMARAQSVDFTATHMLEQVSAMLDDRGGSLILCNLPASLPTGQDLQRYFHQLELGKDARGFQQFETLDDALEWAEDRILEEQGAKAPATELPLDLAEFTLTEGFNAEQLAAFRGCVEERGYRPDDVLLHQRDRGDELLLIRKGKVRIVMSLGDSGRHHNVATFGRGDFFGEIAFLTQKKRTAHAIAIGPTEVYVVHRAQFDAFCQQYPAVGVAVLKHLATDIARRLRNTDKELRHLQEA